LKIEQKCTFERNFEKYHFTVILEIFTKIIILITHSTGKKIS